MSFSFNTARARAVSVHLDILTSLFQSCRSRAEKDKANAPSSDHSVVTRAVEESKLEAGMEDVEEKILEVKGGADGEEGIWVLREEREEFHRGLLKTERG